MSWQQRVEQLGTLSGIDKLVEIMAMLRDPEHGCPWDLKQTFASIVPYTIEEAYEVADAIEREDYPELKKELGDLLFQSIFYSQLGKEQHLFEFSDVVEGICEKLIRRHPHVFSDKSLQTEQEINANWEQEKSKERAESDKGESVLDDIPRAMPALSRAYKMQKRAASVGFDWPDISGALDKVSEEFEEVKQELAADKLDIDAAADELGDLYFAMTNVVRHLKLKPEQVLHQANQKFAQRFRLVEQTVAEQGKQMNEVSLSELDAIWEQVKAQLKNA